MVLEKVLAQQTTIVNKLHATELLWENESKGKDPNQASNEEEARKVVKLFQARAEPNEKANTCRTVRTTRFEYQSVRNLHVLLWKIICSFAADIFP